jgi:hypothetical protein
MTLRLSINRCGFDMNAAEMRDAISDLTRIAGEVGEVIGMIRASVVAPPVETQARAQTLSAHREWLLAQADLLQEKLAVLERRRSHFRLVPDAEATYARPAGRVPL